MNPTALIAGIALLPVAGPADYVTGPYCPVTVDTPARQLGTWFANDEVGAADGAFIRSLAVACDDDEWQMFDPETGEVFRADGELGCAVAGDPASGEADNSNCVECELRYLDPELSQTYVIPLVPVALEAGQDPGSAQSGVGLAFNGVSSTHLRRWT